jgi:hypothetical protein
MIDVHEQSPLMVYARRMPCETTVNERQRTADQPAVASA